MENNVANKVRVRKIPKEEINKTPPVTTYIMNKSKPVMLLTGLFLLVTGIIYIIVKSNRIKRSKLFLSSYC